MMGETPKLPKAQRAFLLLFRDATSIKPTGPQWMSARVLAQDYGFLSQDMDTGYFTITREGREALKQAAP